MKKAMKSRGGLGREVRFPLSPLLLPCFYFFALLFTSHRSPLSERLEQARASIKSIPTEYHTLGTTFTGCKSIIAAGVSRKRSRVALFEDPRFLFLGEQFVEALCHPSPWPPRTRTLILSHTRTFWQISQSWFFLLCKAFRISLLFKILEKISIFSGSHL